MLLQDEFLSGIMGGRVLVTGFEPFGNHIENISQLVAASLDGEEIRGHTIESLIIKVNKNCAKNSLLYTSDAADE